MNKIKRAATFARVSTTKQSMTSQFKECEDWAKRNGLVVHKFRGGVGSAYKRLSPDLIQLIKTLPRDSMIIMRSVDRAVRNVHCAEHLLNLLRWYSIKIWFIKENLSIPDENGDSVFIGWAKQAQSFSDNLSLKTKEAIRRKRSMGFFCGTVAPFGKERVKVSRPISGYKLRDHPQEQKVVQLIKMLRMPGSTRDDINDLLEEICDFYGKEGGYLQLYYGRGKVRYLRKPLTYTNILYILEDWEIPYRNSVWTVEKIRKICRS